MERVAVRVLYGQARVNHVRALLGSKQIKPSVIERHHGTRRWRHQRQVREALACSNVPR
jgi:hypothetical protein